MEKILTFRRLNKDRDINIKMVKEEKIAEFIGIMLGDGNLGIYNCKAGNKIKKQHRIRISLDSRNKEYTKYVANLLREVLNTEPRIHYKKTENAVDIGTYRKDKFFYVLNNLGLKISPKWGRMKIPEKYSKGRLALFVLKGLFDTDGSVTIFNNNGIIYPRIEIRISPCPAQEQIINILKEHCFSFRIQKLDKGKIKIRISGKKELRNWFEGVGCSNQHYYRRAKRFLEQ